MKLADRVILALDGLDLQSAINLTLHLGPFIYAVKVHDLWDRNGPFVVDRLKKAGARRVWVDLKLHDIPNTVALRAAAVRNAGADIVSVHASGGFDMMNAAVQSKIEVFAITLLTSLDIWATNQIFGRDPSIVVVNLALLAAEAGVAGVVCSPKEVGLLAEVPAPTSTLKRIVPGIRSMGKSAGDQVRIGTPGEAIRAGASHLVIGRQLVEAENPREELNSIFSEIENT